MFDDLETIIDQLGNALQNQPGVAGQIGWGLLAAVALWKIVSAVSNGKMRLGEAGQKLEDLFKNFQWRLEGEDKNGKTIRAFNPQGDTVYSHDDGGFELIDRNGKWHNVSNLLSRRESKRLRKMRKQVVKGLLANHKVNSEAAISMQVENFLNAPTKQEVKKQIADRANLCREVIKSKAKPVEERFQPVGVDDVYVPVKPAITKPVTGGIAGGSCLIGGDKVKIEDYKKPEQIKKMDAPQSPLRDVINEASRFLEEALAKKPVVVEQKPVVQQANKIVVCCPSCRTTRAIIEVGGKIPVCPDCTIPTVGSKVLMTETTADPQEFLKTNPLVAHGVVFKNYGFDNDTRFQAIAGNIKPIVGSVKKQPSETIKDQQIVALFKELNKKDKKAVAKKEEPKVVSAKKIFPNVQPVAAKIEVPKVVEQPKPVVEPVKPVEKKAESEFTLLCCPTCRVARAIRKKGDKTEIICKGEDCNNAKMVETTGNAEEFVLENGMKVTEYLKQSGKNYVRFRNYGDKAGKKFVAVLLPMKNAPVVNGVKLDVKKQPSESIVGYVKKEKKEVVKTVTDKSIVTIKYVQNGMERNETWNFGSVRGGWKNIIETMKGMKVGETRIVTACNNAESNNSQFTVTVNGIA